MDYKKNIIKDIRESSHSLARPYWYFPFELSLLNRDIFNKITKTKTKKRGNLFTNLMENEKYNTESHMEMFYVIVDNNREFIKVEYGALL